MTVQAIGVLVAPENTPTKPIPANRAKGKGIQVERAFPNVAPVKNRGVTSPPLKPAPKVNPVMPVFTNQSYQGSGVSKASTILGTPKPMYTVVFENHTINAITSPPMSGRKGG